MVCDSSLYFKLGIIVELRLKKGLNDEKTIISDYDNVFYGC